MDLEGLPPELVWHILDNLTDLRDRKNASQVCKSWNWMLFNSPVALHSIRLRVCSKVASLDRMDAEEVFNQMSDVMVHSKRNYINVEFFHMNFERPMARELLFFIVQLCCDSIARLYFTNCHGLRRSELWQVLELLPQLTDLTISGGIYYDEFDNEANIAELNQLEILALDIGDDCRLYQDFSTIVPKLTSFSVRTIHGCVDLRDVVLTRNFSHQLSTLSFSTNRCFNQSEFSDMNFTNLTKLDLKLSGSVWPQLFKQMKLLTELQLEAGINDEVIAAICATSTKLRKLSLLCSGLVECKKFNMLSRLENLEDLQLRGIYKFSWRHVILNKLRRLHVDNVATDFTNFLKELTTLKSLEIHDTKLKNEQLIKFTMNAPSVERLELAFCSKLSDKAFKHLSDMPHLQELRLWGINVSKSIDERLLCPKLRTIIFYFNDNIEDSTLESIAQKLPKLRLLVLYDCYRISPQGVANLRKAMPTCSVLELYRGDELPPALVAESQIYYRNAEFPNGVLKQELPFQWY